MAKRPVFLPNEKTYVETVIVPYDYCGGLTNEQRAHSIDNLHKACRELFPEAKALEVTTYSPDKAGRSVCASRLKLPVNKAPRFRKRKRFPVTKKPLIRKELLKKSFRKKLQDKSPEEQEQLIRTVSQQKKCTLKKTNSAAFDVVYQASRVCERGGPFPELLRKRPYEARKSSNRLESGRCIGYRWDKKNIPANPEILFYTWLFLWTLKKQPELGDRLMEYDIFTDIRFFPLKATSCLARASAIYVSLRRRGELEKALEDISFLEQIV